MGNGTWDLLETRTYGPEASDCGISPIPNMYLSLLYIYIYIFNFHFQPSKSLNNLIIWDIFK